MYHLFALFFIAFFLGLNCQILQTDTMANLSQYITTDDPLIIFDIDKTLIKYNPQYKMARNYLKKFDLKSFDIKWFFAEPMEDVGSEIINKIQKKNFKIIALTACKKMVNYYKFYQLQMLGLDFSHSFPHIPNYDIIPAALNRAFYKNGVICSGKNEKGIVLEKFLKQNDIHPSQIIFIDNALKNISSVQQSAEKLAIPFTGIWYTRS